MKLAILDADSLGSGLNLERFSRFGDLAIYGNTLEAERLEHTRNADVLILNRTRIDKEIFDANPQLKLIALTATGYNNIDLAAAKEHSVAVCNVVGYSTPSVAQHTFALLFFLLEHVAEWDACTKSGLWGKKEAPFAHMESSWDEIAGKQWGIIGLGEIGKKVALIAESFGARIVYFSTSDQNRSELWPRLSLPQLMQSSDIISIHSPLNDKTRGLVGKKELEMMKSTGLILNLGRGGIIDEGALAEALDANKIRGAGLDVIFPEPPPPEHPLLHLKKPQKLVLSPHIAWASVESRHRCMEELALNIEAWIKSERRNRVD